MAAMPGPNSIAAAGSQAGRSPIPVRLPRALRSLFKPAAPADPFRGLLPLRIARLRTESDLRVVAPWFFRALDVRGDVCEFGCFRGTMSIKFAFALQVLELDKTVYAFDTFQGHIINDPAGGSLGVGAYSDNDNSFEELQRWSSVIPVRPVKGDARQTASLLTGELAFVWLDLDFDNLLDDVLAAIWPLLHRDTIIGIDDAGRPDTPGVGPWVDRLTESGQLIELARYPREFIRFFHPRKADGWTPPRPCLPPELPGLGARLRSFKLMAGGGERRLQAAISERRRRASGA